MKMIILSVMVLGLLFSGESMATYRIDGMMCAMNCPKKVNESLNGLDGVKSCKVDFESKTATIVYDDEIIFRNQMGKIDKLTKNYPQADWHACIQHIENTQNFISRNGYLPLQMICLFLDIQKSLQGGIYEFFKLEDWTPV